MAVTPILQIEQVSPSQAAKEATINSGTIALEQAGNRRLQVNLAAGDAALSVSQFTRNAVFEFVGHAVDRIVTLPGSAADRLCMVLNSGDGIVTISLGASSVALPPDAAGFISLGMGAIKLVLTGGIESGGEIEPPTGPIDLGLGVNLSASDATISEADYQTYRLFIAVGNAVARTLSFPDGVENFVAVRNEGSATLTVAANGATISIAAGETVPVVTTLTGIVKLAPEPPDYGLVLDATSGNVSVNSANLLARDVFIVSGHSVLRSLTITNGVEKSFVVYNAGSATLNVVAYSTTIAIPAGESRALYTTLSEFKAVTDQVSGGGGGYSAGLFSAVKRVDMSPGTTTVNSTDFDAFNVFIVTAANVTASLRKLYFPNSVSKAFMVANASNYDVQVYFDDGNDAPVTISPGFMELLVQNNVTSTYQAFASAKRKPARHILRFEHKGLIGGDTEMGRFVAHTAMTVKGSDVGAAYFNLGVVSAATFTVSILLNGSSIGSVIFASGVATRTTSTLDFTMAAGDVLTFKSQATADATAAAMSITFPVREVVAV